MSGRVATQHCSTMQPSQRGEIKWNFFEKERFEENIYELTRFYFAKFNEGCKMFFAK
jgi:hypothetical protein